MEHFGQWTPIDLPDVEGDRKFTAYWAEFKTESEAFQRFILQPLPVYAGAFPEVTEEVGEGKGWRVVTAIFGHERGLNPRIVYATATVSAQDRTVYATHYKYDPGASTE